jgi:hypothetical protein
MSDPMSGAGTKDKKPRLTEHEAEHVVSIMEMVRVYVQPRARVARGSSGAYIIPAVVVQGGDQVCQVACIASDSILQLKVKVEVEAGLEARTLAIYMPEIERPLGESVTLEVCGMPSKLYAVKLNKVDMAALVGVRPTELTDAHLARVCLTDKGKAGDIVSLKGCEMLRDMSCLVDLEQMQELGISGCCDIEAATTVATMIAAHT